MANILDTTNPKVIETIIAKYSLKVSGLESNINEHIRQISNNIDFCRTHSEEELIEEVVRLAREKYKTIDSNKALKLAIIRQFANKSKKKIPEAEIQNMINNMTEERKQQLISEYKSDWYGRYTAKQISDAKKNYEFWSCMSDEQKDSYLKLYRAKLFAQDSFEARETAIKETASALKAQPPLCITNMKAVDHIVNRIIKTEDQDEQEKIMAGGIKERLKRFHEAIHDNLGITALGIGVCQIIIPFIGYMTSKVYENNAMTTGTIVASEAVLIAMMTTSMNSDSVKGYFKDKETIEEAKRLGLLDLLVNWAKADKEFYDTKDKIKRENTSIEGIVGGNNGLH